MQIIGTFVFFITSINAAIPPLSSLPPIPSTSSIIIKFFVAMFPIKRVVLSNRKPTLELIDALFLCSDAFVSYV